LEQLFAIIIRVGEYIAQEDIFDRAKKQIINDA